MLHWRVKGATESRPSKSRHFLCAGELNPSSRRAEDGRRPLLAGFLEPLLAPRGTHTAIAMKLGRPRKNLQDEAPGEGRRRRLTGSFVEPDYADPLDKKPPRSGMGAARWWVRPAQPNADDPSDERDTEPMPDFRQPEPWSSSFVLARRAGRTPSTRSACSRSGGRRARRTAIRRWRRRGPSRRRRARRSAPKPSAAELGRGGADARRLAAGEGAGRARADPAERARKRSELAKQRYAKRRQNLRAPRARRRAARGGRRAAEPEEARAAKGLLASCPCVYSILCVCRIYTAHCAAKYTHSTPPHPARTAPMPARWRRGRRPARRSLRCGSRARSRPPPQALCPSSPAHTRMRRRRRRR